MSMASSGAIFYFIFIYLFIFALPVYYLGAGFKARLKATNMSSSRDISFVFFESAILKSRSTYS